MGSLEFFKLDEEGAGWVSFEELDNSTKLDIEIALFQEGALWYLSHQKCPKCPILDLYLSLKNVIIKLLESILERIT